MHIAFHISNDPTGLREKSYMYGPSKRNVVCKIKALCKFKIVVLLEN